MAATAGKIRATSGPKLVPVQVGGNGNTTTVQTEDGDKSLPDASSYARWALVVLAVLGVAIAIAANMLGWNRVAFKPTDAAAAAGITLIGAFYIGAQIIERGGELVSPVLPPWDPPADATTGAAKAAHLKADRATMMLGVSFVAGVVVSFATGLYLMESTGFTVSNTVDVAFTGLVLAGGTKGLHELLTFAQTKKNPDTAKDTKATT